MQPAPKSGYNVRDAMRAVLDLFRGGLLVAYDREIRYRLEEMFPHEMTHKAIDKLVFQKAIVQTALPGRPGIGDRPNQFYKLPETKSEEIIPLMRKKLYLSIFIVGLSSGMGRHAETAWWNAFRRNQWDIYPSSEHDPLGVNSYDGAKASTNHDIDFIAKRDDIPYGVEVKNGLNYPNDLYWKFKVAAELNTIPLIIARWLNPAQVPLLEELGGAKPLVYKDGMYATAYKPYVTEARELLDAPIEPRDDVDDSYFGRKLNEIHVDTKTNISGKRAKIKDFLLRRQNDPSIKGTLGIAGQQ